TTSTVRIARASRRSRTRCSRTARSDVMKLRRLALAIVVGVVALAAFKPRPQGDVKVRIETALGAIDVALDTGHAPGTAGNFLKYVDGGLYDGGRFYRVTRPDNYTPAPPNRPMMEIIQGGIDPSKRSQVLAPIPLERTSVTGLKHVTGTISMARGTSAD